MTCTKRNFLVAVVASWALAPAIAGTRALPSTQSLQADLSRALQSQKPLVVMVSLEGCPFCKVARESYLLPLYEREGIPIVQVDMRNKEMMLGFDGVKQTQDDWIRALGVKVAPTVLFFGPNGVEVAERMTGGYIPDFYGSYLDERLQTAKLRIAKLGNVAK